MGQRDRAREELVGMMSLNVHSIFEKDPFKCLKQIRRKQHFYGRKMGLNSGNTFIIIKSKMAPHYAWIFKAPSVSAQSKTRVWR